MTVTIQPINYDVNLLQALLWQYNDAVNLQGILNARQDWYNTNQTQFWEDWYDNVFNLKTANDFGLAVWAIILGFSLFINLTTSGNPTWGFGKFHLNFDNGNFSNGEGQTIRLTTETSRIMLRLRAYQLQTAGCIPEINRMLADVFSSYVAPGDVPAYVEDNLDMTCTYHFLFPVPTEIILALRYFDVLPRPAGVKSDIVID